MNPSSAKRRRRITCQRLTSIAAAAEPNGRSGGEGAGCCDSQSRTSCRSASPSGSVRSARIDASVAPGSAAAAAASSVARSGIDWCTAAMKHAAVRSVAGVVPPASGGDMASSSLQMLTNRLTCLGVPATSGVSVSTNASSAAVIVNFCASRSSQGPWTAASWRRHAARGDLPSGHCRAVRCSLRRIPRWKEAGARATSGAARRRQATLPRTGAGRSSPGSRWALAPHRWEAAPSRRDSAPVVRSGPGRQATSRTRSEAAAPWACAKATTEADRRVARPRVSRQGPTSEAARRHSDRQTPPSSGMRSSV